MDEKYRAPDLDRLAMLPHYGCNSASAIFVAQAQCLGQRNCTIDVNFNNTFEWEETENGPCAEGLVTHRGSSVTCSVKLDSPSSNFTLCPKEREDMRFVVRGICDSRAFTFDALTDPCTLALYHVVHDGQPASKRARTAEMLPAARSST